MKKVFGLLVVLIFVFLIVSFFIPVRLEKKRFIANSFPNIVSSIFGPENWTHWEPSVSRAWQRDSSSCQFSNDSTHHIVTIGIPGKTFRVTQLSLSVYEVEEIQKGDTSAFGFGIIPFVGNGRQRSDHNSYVVYAQAANLFYKMFPFMAKPSFADSTVAALRSYLEDVRRFYGYPIDVQLVTDTLFITNKKDIHTRDLFKTIAATTDLLQNYAAKNNCAYTGANLSFIPLPHDSITFMEGLNINKTVSSNDTCVFRQLPSDQYLAVAQYEGRFRDRPALYAAMAKFLFDHQLIRNGLPLEKYLGPLPTSDSSIIKMELSYPLRSH
jgi:hypothetical protein